MTIRAISIHQPYATLIAQGRKQYETRPRPIRTYRGQLLICAAKATPFQSILSSFGLNPKDCPLGVAVAIAHFADCIPMTPAFIAAQTEEERQAGNWTEGQYAYQLQNIMPIQPIPIRGQQGLWKINLDDLNITPVRTTPYFPSRVQPKQLSLF